MLLVPLNPIHYVGLSDKLFEKSLPAYFTLKRCARKDCGLKLETFNDIDIIKYYIFGYKLICFQARITTQFILKHKQVNLHSLAVVIPFEPKKKRNRCFAELDSIKNEMNFYFCQKSFAFWNVSCCRVEKFGIPTMLEWSVQTAKQWARNVVWKALHKCMSAIGLNATLLFRYNL